MEGLPVRTIPPRWIPRSLAVIGAAHLGVAAVEYRRPLGAMASAGVVNSVGGDAERDAAVWFTLGGVAMLTLAEVARWGVRETGRVPRRLGAGLVALGAPLVVVMPASGGWALLGAGAATLAAAR